MSRAWTLGIDHVGLSVKDLETTVAFFKDSLGFWEVGRKPEYPSVFVTDGKVMVTLWQLPDPDAARAFDRKANAGLHHLALRVESAEALQRLHEHLAQTPGVRIEFGPEPLGSTGAVHMVFEEPGGLRLELIARPQAS